MITIPEAARLLSRDVSLIRRWCQQGRIRGATKQGRDWLIPTPLRLDGIRHRK